MSSSHSTVFWFSMYKFTCIGIYLYLLDVYTLSLINLIYFDILIDFGFLILNLVIFLFTYMRKHTTGYPTKTYYDCQIKLSLSYCWYQITTRIMEKDTLNSSPTVMFSGTPCSR